MRSNQYDPEFAAVILAGTCGARLFPISYSGEDHDTFGTGVDNDDDDDDHRNEDGAIDKFRVNCRGVAGADDPIDVLSGNDDDDGGEGGNEKNHNNDNTKHNVETTPPVKPPTSSYMPKHLLPLVGRPILYHLLLHLKKIGFELCIIAIASNDDATVPSLISEMEEGTATPPPNNPKKTTASPPSSPIRQTKSHDGNVHTIVWEESVTIVVVNLPRECGGSADALRHLSGLTHDHHGADPSSIADAAMDAALTDETAPTPAISPPPAPILPRQSHVMILPGDLILYGHLSSSSVEEDGDALSNLADAHRANAQTHPHQTALHYHTTTATTTARRPKHRPPSAITLLLTDVSEYDDNGIPLKESAKAKRGGIARDDDEIEYIALSSAPRDTTAAAAAMPSPNPTLTPQRSTTSSHPSTQHPAKPPPRILLKQAKYSVEEEVENTASTPKLTIPKATFHYQNNNEDGDYDGDRMTIRTDWSDVHVFCMSPWVLRLLEARRGVKDLGKELVPLLIQRQFRGVRAAFGVKEEGRGGGGKGVGGGEEKRRLLEGVLAEAPFCVAAAAAAAAAGIEGIGRRGSGGGGAGAGAGGAGGEAGGKNDAGTGGGDTNRRSSGTGSETNGGGGVGSGVGGGRHGGRNGMTKVDYPFVVGAEVVSRAVSRLTLRACTIPAYLYGCRETTLYATARTAPAAAPKGRGGGGGGNNNAQNPNPEIPLPPDTSIDTKFHSLRLSDTVTGEKVQIKSSTVGRRSKLGGRCKVNNVVLMDDVTIGDNCVLQNSVLAKGCVVGDNCNLKDCQVGAGYRIVDGTKATGECFFDG